MAEFDDEELKSAQDYYNLGAELYEKEEYPKAIEAFRKAASLNSLYKEAYYNLGALYYKTGNIDKSILSYRDAIDIDARFIDAIYNLALIYIEIEEYEQAVEMYKKVTAVNPNDADGFFNLGVVYYNLTKKAFEEVIRIDSKHEGAIKCLEFFNKLNLSNESDDEAIDIIAKPRKKDIIAPKEDKEEKQVVKEEKPAEPPKVLKSRYEPPDPNLRDQKFFLAGLKCAESENYKEAIQNFAACLALNPNHSEAHGTLMSMLEWLKNKSAYEEDDKNYKEAECLYRLGYVFEDQQRYELAIMNYEKALSLYPDNGVFLEALTRVQQKSGYDHITANNSI